MVPILVGTVSFLLILLSDFADSKGIGSVKWASVAVAAASLVWAAIRLVSSNNRFSLPLWAQVSAAALAAVFFLLLVYSVLLEVRFLGRQPKGEQRCLVSSGTYALNRHPGVLWFFFLHLFGAIASGSWPLLLAVPFWTGANVLVALVEDRKYCPLLFGVAYDEYRRHVPFLIPTGRSVHSCAVTLRPPRRTI